MTKRYYKHETADFHCYKANHVTTATRITEEVCLFSDFRVLKVRRTDKETIHLKIPQGTKKNQTFFLHRDIPYLGASPDGLIGEDGIVEVKCPFSAAEITPEEVVLAGKIKVLVTVLMSRYLLQSYCPGTCYSPTVQVLVTVLLSRYLLQSYCPGTSHCPTIQVLVTVLLSRYLSQSYCPGTCYSPTVQVLVTVLLSRYLSQSYCPGTCHSPTVQHVVSLADVLQQSIALPSRPETERRTSAHASWDPRHSDIGGFKRERKIGHMDHHRASATF
uniref:YqaJ viral recombinase domain-containing protein n=1 Tax=Timema douglasi TaxID=61478 RepID=A0A7R8VV47_TIMDO|nr:unnamed protein product [Timema douglasi]